MNVDQPLTVEQLRRGYSRSPERGGNAHSRDRWCFFELRSEPTRVMLRRGRIRWGGVQGRRVRGWKLGGERRWRRCRVGTRVCLLLEAWLKGVVVGVWIWVVGWGEKEGVGFVWLCSFRVWVEGKGRKGGEKKKKKKRSTLDREDDRNGKISKWKNGRSL